MSLPSVSREQVTTVLPRMGYELRDERDDLLLFRDASGLETPMRLILFDFSHGPIARTDIQKILEYEGIPAEAFFAELESL